MTFLLYHIENNICGLSRNQQTSAFRFVKQCSSLAKIQFLNCFYQTEISPTAKPTKQILHNNTTTLQNNTLQSRVV